MQAFFIDLFEYNQLANQLILDQVIKYYDEVPHRTLSVAAHIQSAHYTWNRRIQHQSGLGNVWEALETAKLPAYNIENNDVSRAIINNANLEAAFSYKTTKGLMFTNTYTECLFHVVNHGTYHRGQINAALRTAGIEPVPVDYVLLRR